jgi:hypothetical protein
MRRGWGRNAMMRMGRGIPIPVYEDMHATDIRRTEKKLKSMRRPKSRKQPEVYSVVLCDHQACSFVRTYDSRQ